MVISSTVTQGSAQNGERALELPVSQLISNPRPPQAASLSKSPRRCGFRREIPEDTDNSVRGSLIQTTALTCTVSSHWLWPEMPCSTETPGLGANAHRDITDGGA